ncbi:MAG TPA: GMC family oxidoreductase [Pedobacter sp.]|nr:GMC family oxidoreductase [Pedobacter sp.]
MNYEDLAPGDLEADVCVIGAGAAGFACAKHLLSSGMKVLVVEGGLEQYHQAAADLHKSEVRGFHHTGIHDARERVVGGTTTKWGGQALPFMAEDFKVRPHVKLSGWPISLNELMPYYKMAESILGTDVSVPYEYKPWSDSGIPIPDLNQGALDLFVTKWCKIPNFALQHGSAVRDSDEVTLLYNANVLELIPGPDKSAVAAVKIRSLGGKESLVKARVFIAAGGAIESVRLFLNSVQFGTTGPGNAGGKVGLYFQDHVAAVVGQVIPVSRTDFQNLFDSFYRNGFKYFPRLRLNPDRAEKQNILHASAQIVYSSEANDPLTQAKQMLTAIRKKEATVGFRDLIKLANPYHLLRLARAVMRWKIEKRGSSPEKGPIWLEIHSEQEPSLQSTISLSDQRDEMGMRRVSLHWHVSALTARTIRETAGLVSREFKAAGIAEVRLEPWVNGAVADGTRWMTDVYHQAGGLRMSEYENDGVVDRDCKVFGLSNLYVASSAVFPTSSFSNPTMTTIALSLRICDRIKSIHNNN